MGKEGLQPIDFNQRKIEIALRDARQYFLRKDLNRSSRDLVYDPEFDRRAYGALGKFQNDPEYREAKERLDAFTKNQLITLLAEREHTALSTNRLRIENGVVYPENNNEPFLDMVRRGRDYRRLYGNPIDFKREDGEVFGQEQGIGILANRKTPKGTMILSISPRGDKGSSYIHNFFDVLTKKEGMAEGEIEIKRYSSSLSIDEFADKFTQISGLSPLVPDAAFFLSHPLEIKDKKFKSSDDVARFLGKDESFMSEAYFQQQIARRCDALINAYIASVSENPDDKETQELIYRALLNKPDEIKEEIRKGIKVGDQSQVIYQRDAHMVKADIGRLGNRKVKTVATGCGSSGADSSEGLVGAINKIFEIKLSSEPFSVSDFGKKEDDLGDREFLCPVCKHKNIRPYNEKIPLCQNEGCPDRTKVAC